MIDDNMVKQIYARAQRKLFVNNLALSLANREPGDALKVQGGRKYHKPIIGFSQMQQYTPLTATASSQNVATENEELIVDRASHAESIHINIDDTEKAQLRDQDLEARYGDDLGRAMKDSIEKRWVSNIVGINTIGSDSDPVDFSGSNILDVVEEGLGLVDTSDVDDLQRVLLIGPREYRAIERATASRESKLGDATFVNGFPARQFMDALLVKSNNLPWKATLTIGANPTDGDTVTVNKTTFTFKTSLGTTAGQVKIGASASATADNLLAAIAGTGTVGTDYIDLGLTDKMHLRRNRRVAGTNASGVISFTGFGDVGTASSFTSTSNKWSAQVKSIFFTAVGATDLALQLDDGLEMSRPKPMTGEAHFTRLSGVTLHNSKTFTDGQYMTVPTVVDASGY